MSAHGGKADSSSNRNSIAKYPHVWSGWRLSAGPATEWRMQLSDFVIRIADNVARLFACFGSPVTTRTETNQKRTTRKIEIEVKPTHEKCAARLRNRYEVDLR